MKDSLNKLTSYLGRLTQQKTRNKLTSTLDDLTQQNARMESPQAVAYVLKITITGTGVGTVIRSPDTNSFVNGQVVSLKAKAQAGSKFVRWTGDVTGSHGVCNIRMNSTKFVVAEFIRVDFRAEQKIGSTFAAISNSEMKQIETRHSSKVVISPIRSDTSNSASFVEHKDIPCEHIGLDNRFIDHKDGTVSDTRTGLMWMRPAVGQPWNNGTCSGIAKKISMLEAQALQLGFASYNDWRLPTIHELQGLIKAVGFTSKLDSYVFPNQSAGYYWSSTRLKGEHDNWPKIISSNGTLGFGNPETGSEYLRLVRDTTAKVPIIITLIGTGSGIVTRNPEADAYFLGSFVTLTVHPSADSGFKSWHGDASGQEATLKISVDSAKTISAEFIPLKYFGLKVNSTGTGKGTIAQSPQAETYVQGSTVTLTAQASLGSYFEHWHGAATGRNVTCKFTMDSAKSVSAEFTELEFFRLEVLLIGGDKGFVTQILQAETYAQGSTVTLTAHAKKGFQFKRWHGAANGRSTTCTITLDSAKTVSAEFVQLKSFALDVTITGTGSGRVARSVNADTYFSGSLLTLTAQADEGSIFNGWHGDASGVDEVCNVTMNSPLSVGAEFEKLTISDTVITIEIEKAEIRLLKDQLVNIFYIIIRNRRQEQVRIKIPLTSFVSQVGQASEQNGWFSGLGNGSKGVTLTAGAFCVMGLVYFHSDLKRGDRLLVNVVPSKPLGSINFIFKCIDAGNAFILVNSSSEDKNQLADAIPTLPAMTKLLKRIESLENSLSEVLRRLDGMQSNIPWTVKNLAFDQASPSLTLPEVLKWLALQDRISVVELRARLLPLDMMPGAVINEINERSLDLCGELALEEAGNEIVVEQAIFEKLLANWDVDQS